VSEAASIPTPGSAANSGLQLAAARQSCNLSVADVAHQLKLSPAQVEAMEAGEYQRLPGAVFVRGFIRNYARLVKLDPEPLVAQAEQRLPAPPPAVPELASPADIPFPSGREFRWQKYALGALLIVAALVAFEFYGSSSDTTPDVTVKSRPGVVPQPAGDAATAPAASGVTQGAAASEAEPKPPATAPTQAPVSAASTAANAERKPGEHRVRLVFEKESWVEIRDRNGRRIFSQLNRAGTTQEVTGPPPLTLVVGNASGVRLTHNDNPVNLAPHTNVNVARLTLE
jgi:cytoskeleton protein RodZ